VFSRRAIAAEGEGATAMSGMIHEGRVCTTTPMNHWIQMTDVSLDQDSERRAIHLVTPTADAAGALLGSPPLVAVDVAARVVIVSGLRLLRDGLSDALGRASGIGVAAAVADADQARVAIAAHAPTLVLIDMEMRDSLALVREISAVPCAPKIVVFAVSDSEDALLAYIEAGICGYVARDGSLSDVVATVESVRRGETIVSPKLAASLFRRLASQRRPAAVASNPAEPELTSREREILRLVEQGMTNKEIARSLGIELATVKNHVHHVLEKLKVSRRGQAAARARGVTRV
jgi:two-component system, NarL family, nitrate/nitrite response regulator NarL